MSRFTVGRHESPGDPADAPENPVVRQYRYLLRTAPADALEAAHTEAIPRLSEAHQASLLATLRTSLLVGSHLTTGDHAKIAHLVTAAERRSPGVLLAVLPPEVLQNLAATVVDSEASFGLLSGYAGWDGAEPQPPDDPEWADGGYDPKSGSRDGRNDARVVREFHAPETAGGGG